MSASKSPKVNKSAIKPVKKYASRHVGEILQSMIDDTVAKTKTNPKATAKWLSKLKLSIQRKVSKFSVLAYSSPTENADSLKAEIKMLKAQIGDKLKSIQKVHLQSINSTNLTQPNVSDSSVSAGSYSSSTKNILDKFKHISEQLSSSNKDASDRYAKFNASLRTIQTNLPTVLSGLHQRAAASLEADVAAFGSGVSFRNGPVGDNNKISPIKNSFGLGLDSNSDREDAAFDKLLEHLESN